MQPLPNMNIQRMRFAILAAVISVSGSSALGAGGAITPPKIIQTVEARFPLALEKSTIPRGDVTLLISIGPDGKLRDTLVLAYSHEEFAREAKDVLSAWRFEPAQMDGKPIGCRVTLNMEFTTKAHVVDLFPVDTLAALIHRPDQFTGRKLVAEPAELDQPLAIVRGTQPQLAAPPANGPEGRAVVEFYVDTEGRARVPVVLESTDPVFTDAALRALGDWQFSVPMRSGEPVIVRTRQEFVFSQKT